MIRAAALVSGDGLKLQAILDSVYFKEIPDFELIAVISSSKEANAMKRAINFNIPAYVVDPELFPNITSHSMAVTNKLVDMDIDLVIIAGYDMPLGVIPYKFRNKMIGTCPAIYPAFEDYPEAEICAEVINRGIKLTGATAFFYDNDGRVGSVISQKPIEVLPGDTAETLARRVTEEGEWKLLTAAVKLFCERKLTVNGKRVVVAETPKRRR